ncbi:multicopper oxidase domain-containing protein [Escherichia coli]
MYQQQPPDRKCLNDGGRATSTRPADGRSGTDDVASRHRAPVLPIRQNAATLWYHANTPNRTAQQVYNGLAGMWLVEDEVSKSLPIPNHYGVDDFPVIIQDKRLDNFGTPEYN